MFTLKSRLFLRIMGSYVLLLSALLVIVDSFMSNRVHTNYVNHEKSRLETAAVILSELLPQDTTERALQPWVQQQGTRTGFRITLIGTNGQVLADNQHDPAQMDNHANRPEIQEARREGKGSAIRFSRTLGKNELYLAYRVPPTHPSDLVLRLALPLEEVSAGFHSVQRAVFLISLLSFLLALLLGYLFTRSLTRRIARIQEFSQNVARGNLDARVQEIGTDELGSLARSLNTTADKMQRDTYELRKEKNRITAILEGVRAGVLAADAEERVTLMNPALARILRVDPQQNVGRKILEVVRSAELKRIFDQVLAEGKEVTATVEMALSPPRIFEVVAVPLNEPLLRGGVVAVFHDVTRLTELENIRRDFVANVSHELRTPLTSIRGFAETLLDGGLGDKKNNRRFVEIIKSHAIRLSDLTRDLLTLATLESDSFSLKHELLDLKSLVQEVIETSKPSSSLKKQEITFRVAEELPAFKADRDKLRQVLINLIDNAIKFTPEEGTVSLEAGFSSERNSVEIHVRDNGIGILSSDLPRIFERFYRGDKARSREQGGTGLGLAIVKHIVEAHKGRIEVRSSTGRGSDFAVFLPLEGAAHAGSHTPVPVG